MRKTATLITIIACIVIVLVIYHKTNHHLLPQAKSFSIGLITKETPCHYKINNGIKDAALQSKTHFSIKEYVSKDQDQILTAALVDEALFNKHDLLISVGAHCSQVASAVIKKRLSQTPLVFAGPGNPVELGIIDNTEHPGGTVTGVNMGDGSLTRAGEMLYALKGLSMQKLLIPYSPHTIGGILVERAQALSRFFEAKGIKTTLLPLETLAEITTKIKHTLPGHDTLITLEGCLSNDVIPAIIKLCDEKQVSLFASEPDHVKKGAAAGYGYDVSLVGEAALKYAGKILTQNIKPGTLPVWTIEKSNSPGRRLIINTAACEKQGLNVDLATLPDKENCVIYSTIEPWE